MPKKAGPPKTSGKRKKWGSAEKEKDEHFERDIFVEDTLRQTIINEVPKMKMITHALVSQKYNIRISIVKQILKELLAENKIKPYIEANRLKVFVPA